MLKENTKMNFHNTKNKTQNIDHTLNKPTKYNNIL